MLLFLSPLETTPSKSGPAELFSSLLPSSHPPFRPPPLSLPSPSPCSDFRLYVHDKTGAEVISCVSPDDENKTFGAVLRTPVDDSKGVPHILEHSVLCGSRKYPIKEPFVELMKGSLNTFLNAFTYPDRTCYPVASANLADFYNLVDVYLDAVLHPRCVEDPRTFAQEGWHLEADAEGAGEGGEAAPSSAAESLRLKGVVFNEMKGEKGERERESCVAWWRGRAAA